MRRSFASVLLLLAACTVTSAPPDANQTGPGTGAPSPGTTVSPGTSGSGTPGPGGSPQKGPQPGSASYPELAGVGAMATSYLRASPARSLLVEVDWMSDRKPSSSGLAHLESILRRELVKPDGVEVRFGAEMTTSRSTWTVDDMVQAERQFRALRSGGARATMWIAFVGGSFAENDSALGAAFTASAAVIFRDRISDAASALLLASEIERSVLVHEAGHLLGLVNIGYRSGIDHEDAAHPHHSNNPDSVMYWAVEDLSIRNLLTGGPPDDFDAADRADLAMLRDS